MHSHNMRPVVNWCYR